MAKTRVVKAKDTLRKPTPKFTKGRRTEIVTMGKGKDAAKLTIKGLSYGEYIYLQSLDNQAAHRDQLRMCITAVENLREGDEVAVLTWETEEIDGKDTKMMTEKSWEEWFGNAILLNGQILAVCNDLTGLSLEDAQAVRIFRPGQPTGMQKKLQVPGGKE